MVTTVWGSMLALALVSLPDPLRFTAVFLVISRPRPVRNLLAYWVGALTVSFLLIAAPLTALRFTPRFRSLVEDFIGSATRSTSHVQPVTIAFGVILLLIAALLLATRRAEPATDSAPAHVDEAVAVKDANPRPSLSRQTVGGRNAATMKGPRSRRVFGRLYDSWKTGSPWISLAMGLTYWPPQVFLALTILAASGSSLGSQLSAGLAFVVLMLGVVEAILLSCVVAPSSTRRVVRGLHLWTTRHHRRIAATICAVVGVALVAVGSNVV